MAGSQRFEDLDGDDQRRLIREAIRLDLEGRDDLWVAAREAGVSEASLLAALDQASPQQRKTLSELMPVLAVFWAAALWVTFAFNGTGLASMVLWFAQLLVVPVLCAVFCDRRKGAVLIASGTTVSGVLAFVSLLGWPVNDRAMLVILPLLSAALAGGLHVLVWRQRTSDHASASSG